MMTRRKRQGGVVQNIEARMRTVQRRVDELEAALRRIQELATDTPTDQDADDNLNAIFLECETVLTT
jgi:phosphopantetheine adenylyltransferase